MYSHYIWQICLITATSVHVGKFYRSFEVCEASAVGWIFACQPGDPGFNPRPGRGLNFEIPSFATPPVDKDVKSLVQLISRRSIGVLFKKEPTYLSIRVG